MSVSVLLDVGYSQVTEVRNRAGPNPVEREIQRFPAAAANKSAIRSSRDPYRAHLSAVD